MGTKIQSELIAMGNETLRQFNAKLMPNVSADTILGISTPNLRKYAKSIENQNIFVNTLPHKYFEENQIHSIILSNLHDFDTTIIAVDKFLPYIDNWATCDQLVPKIFAKHTDKLLPWIRRWIESNHTYTVRFAIGVLMRFYLGDKFQPEYARMVVNVKSDEYYVNMMRAWYFATALAKNWDDIIPILSEHKLDKWTHNKTIQKSIESFRISSKNKQYLRKLRC